MTARTFEDALQAALPVVYRRLVRSYGDEQLADEMTWDSLTKAFEVWRADPTYFASRDLARWAGNRANWRTLDALRKRARLAPLGEDRDDGEAGPAPLIDARHTDDALRRERERELVFAGIGQLADADREIVESYYYGGETDQQIGARLHGESGNDQSRGLRVWRRRRRAHAQLHAILLGLGFDPADASETTSQVN